MALLFLLGADELGLDLVDFVAELGTVCDSDSSAGSSSSSSESRMVIVSVLGCWGVAVIERDLADRPLETGITLALVGCQARPASA